MYIYICVIIILYMFVNTVDNSKIPCMSLFSAELISILVKLRPHSCLSEESYKNYINLLLSVFYLATRNLPELKHLVSFVYLIFFIFICVPS